MIPRDRVRRRILLERITAFVVLSIAVLLLITSIDYGLFLAGAPGPGLFPAIVAGALGLTSLVWFITGGIVREEPVSATDSPALDGDARRVEAEDLDDIADVSGLEAGTDQDTGLAHDDNAIDAPGARMIAFCIVWAIVPILFIQRLGFILTVTIYVGGMLIVIAKTPWWKSILGSLVGAIILFFLGDLLGIALPQDPLGFFRALGL